MYCALNSLVSCGNAVTWPSGRLMNQSIIVPTIVFMNSLHLTASEPPTNIICVWKALRWASESSVPVKVTLGRTNVAGITASMISCENDIGNSLGGVTGSRSLSSRPPAWFCRSLRNSSFERRSSSFVARDTAKSAWMRSWFALDAAISSLRAYIVSITCCRVTFSPPFGATGPYLVLLIFLVLAGGTMFCIGPHGGRQMFLPVDLRAFVRLTILSRPFLCAFARAFLSFKHLNSQRQRAP